VSIPMFIVMDAAISVLPGGKTCTKLGGGAGFLLSPVAIILMVATVLLLIVRGFYFDPYWFTIIFTTNMEIGLITWHVGLNLYVINGIILAVPSPTSLNGAMSFMLSWDMDDYFRGFFASILTDST
jgi:hypothetical protein